LQEKVTAIFLSLFTDVFVYISAIHLLGY